jgi:hypothetical protein
MLVTDLFESVSSIVYHATRLYNAAQILADARFRLAASSGTDTERNLQKGNKPYYLSTTRSKVGDYTLHQFYKDGVVFVLNGDWFNHNYKGGPVDYWGHNSKMWRGDIAGQGGLKGRYSEMEDRVFSDQPFIPLPKNPKDLIKAVHILYKPDNDTRRNQYMRILLTKAKQLGIPHYVYEDDAAYVLQDTRKAIPLTSEFIKSLANPEIQKIGTGWTDRMKSDYLKGWREIYYAKDKVSLSKEGKRTADKVLYYLKDAYSGLSADIHNVKAKADPGLVKLIKIFKKMGVSSSNQYVDAMRAKWEPIYKQAEEEYWADIKKRKDAEDAERNKSDWTTANLA